ncbi:MAG: transglutaminase family protein [Methanocalculaceae archaeon]|jgi:transglutaminase-like putative cysteine protease|nr:transglutaminase family protein [Methanocalculaceae archaeon]
MDFSAFLAETPFVDHRDPGIQKCAAGLFSGAEHDQDRVEAAYVFVRDCIPHTFDIGADIVPTTASEVLRCGTGICHTKALLLAALLRSVKIPAGFCYQRVTLADDDAEGYCLHCFNAVFLAGRWIYLDARGNTNGKNAQFSPDGPKLAYPSLPGYEECFFSGIYAAPHAATMAVLEKAETLQDILDGMYDTITDVPDISENGL